MRDDHIALLEFICLNPTSRCKKRMLVSRFYQSIRNFEFPDSYREVIFPQLDTCWYELFCASIERDYLLAYRESINP